MMAAHDPSVRSQRRMAHKISVAGQRLGRRKQEESGAVAVEGALVFGIFALLIFGIIEFGLFFMFWSTGRSATTEAAHELGVNGTEALADRNALFEVRNQLRRIENNIEYVIVYRAQTILDPVPNKCIEAAELGKIDPDQDPTKPHGYFKAGAETDPRSFDWADAEVRPDVACNVYFTRNLQILDDNPEAFITNLNEPDGDGLDAFWPSSKRTDWITGPVDYGVVYVKTTYKTVSGIVPTRSVTHRAVVQIEPKKANR
jgi:hypothetical protein